MIGPLNLHLQKEHDLKRGVVHREGGFSVWAEGVRQNLAMIMTRLFFVVKNRFWQFGLLITGVGSPEGSKKIILVDTVKDF
jgi:hypothetical protein